VTSKTALSLQDRADLLGELLRATTFPSQEQPGTLTHFSAITSLNNHTQVSAGRTDPIKRPQQTLKFQKLDSEGKKKIFHERLQKTQNKMDIFRLRTMDIVSLPGCCCLYLP